LAGDADAQPRARSTAAHSRRAAGRRHRFGVARRNRSRDGRGSPTRNRGTGRPGPCGARSAAREPARAGRAGVLRGPVADRDRLATGDAAGHDQNAHAPGAVEPAGRAGRAEGMSTGAPDHDALREQLSAYAIGALTDAERAIVEAHLGGCSACTAELATFLPLSGALAQIVPQHDPPAALRARILESA